MTVRGASAAEEVARNCDVLVTGGPIEKNRKPVIVPEWISPGTTVVTIDYDSYVTDELIAAMDLVLTDDQGQIEDSRRNEGKFPGVNRIDATVADLVASGQGERTSDTQRILAFNLGIALEDLATAKEILRRAEETGRGFRYDFRLIG